MSPLLGLNELPQTGALTNVNNNVEMISKPSSNFDNFNENLRRLDEMEHL